VGAGAADEVGEADGAGGGPHRRDGPGTAVAAADDRGVELDLAVAVGAAADARVERLGVGLHPLDGGQRHVDRVAARLEGRPPGGEGGVEAADVGGVPVFGDRARATVQEQLRHGATVPLRGPGID
jgi:hypothetical protein